MQLEEELLAQLRKKNERSRYHYETRLYSLLSDPCTLRLDLDNASKEYNRLQAKHRWEDFAQKDLNCAPLGPGIWAEWRDENMRNARVACALIALSEENAAEFPGLPPVESGWQFIARPVTTLPDGRIFILPLDIVVLVDEQGRPVARFPLPDDENADLFQLMQPFNFGSNLLLTSLLGVSRVHGGSAKRSRDGRVLSA